MRRCSQSRCRCGRGESLGLAPMWRRAQDLFPRTPSGTCCIRCRCGRSEPGAEAGGPELCRAKSMLPCLAPDTHTHTRARAPAQTTTRAHTHRHTRPHPKTRRHTDGLTCHNDRQRWTGAHGGRGGRQTRRQTRRRTHRQIDGRADSPRERQMGLAGRQTHTRTHTRTLMHALRRAHALTGCLALIGPNSLSSLV